MDLDLIKDFCCKLGRHFRSDWLIITHVPLVFASLQASESVEPRERPMQSLHIASDGRNRLS